ncbi:Hypothetical protein I595_1114 [Croceitalea dokdonensis DOKDO 023]|uniref:GIY-YIG domain-containing protein n=2 Tax=Croceitalea TaxID=574891 RepID=A0A0P7B145_9FLAO|nr:Hypothetical protein I595_1114 [Croceitalea dokdonensis DOKDO 023]
MRGFLFNILAMHHLYIIYSKKMDRYYVGQTPEIAPRLAQHNAHHFKRSFTKGAEDWQLVFSKECKDRGDACKRDCLFGRCVQFEKNFAYIPIFGIFK